MNNSAKKIELGTKPTELSPPRDAVHIAVIKARAYQSLLRGQWVKISDGEAIACAVTEGAIGIIDPFGPALIHESEWTWIVIKPGTVTDLRHTWDHPSLPAEEAEEEDGEDEDEYDGCSGC